MNLLALLKQIEWHQASDYDECPSCGKHQHDTPENGHAPDCELKAAIDMLEEAKFTERPLTDLEQFMSGDQWTREELAQLQDKKSTIVSINPLDFEGTK